VARTFLSAIRRDITDSLRKLNPGPPRSDSGRRTLRAAQCPLWFNNVAVDLQATGTIMSPTIEVPCLEEDKHNYIHQLLTGYQRSQAWQQPFIFLRISTRQQWVL